MLNWAGEHEKGDYQGVSCARIGLVGPPGAGATGLVWSLMVNSAQPGSTAREGGWRFDPHASAKPTDDDLLSYLNPRSAQSSPEERRSQGYTNQLPRKFGYPISDFLASGVSGGWSGSSDHRTTLIKIFDTSMARPHGLGTRNEPGWAAHAYDSASHIVLCHPMDSEAQQQSWADEKFEYGRLLERLVQRCRGDAGRGKNPLRTLVVAFTRYDLAFVESADQALRAARNPGDARDRLCDELRKCDVLREALQELSEIRKLRLVGIPVSTYGFMPDGRPNYDGWLRSPERDAGAAMLTRPDIYCDALAAMHYDGAAERDERTTVSSKAELAWLLQHWRPFMTADPFAACISRDDNERIFPISDLLAQVSARDAAYG